MHKYINWLFYSKVFIYIIISFSLFILFENFNFELKVIYISFLFALFISMLLRKFKINISNYFFSKKIVVLSISVVYFLNLGLMYHTLNENIDNRTSIDYVSFVILKPILKVDYITIDNIIEDIQSKKYIDKVLRAEATNTNFVFQIAGTNYQTPLLNKVSLSILVVFIFYLLFLIHDEEKNIVTYRKGMNFIIIGSVILVVVLFKTQLRIKLHQNMASIAKKDFIGWHNIIYITENHKNIYTINRRMK